MTVLKRSFDTVAFFYAVELTCVCALQVKVSGFICKNSSDGFQSIATSPNIPGSGYSSALIGLPTSARKGVTASSTTLRFQFRGHL